MRSTDRNLRVLHREYANGGWRFHPAGARGGFTRERYTYDSVALRYADRTENATELGLDYLPSTDSRIGLQLRHLKGSYPYRNNIAGLGLDTGYEQDEVKANILLALQWHHPGAAAGRLGQAQNQLFAGRDSSGANGRLTVYWAPLGKVRFTGSVWHEFAAVADYQQPEQWRQSGRHLGCHRENPRRCAAAPQRDFSEVSQSNLPGDVSDTTHRLAGPHL